MDLAESFRNTWIFHILFSREPMPRFCPRAEKYEGPLSPALEGGTDLVPAMYEGGLKIWECSEDLVRYRYRPVVGFRSRPILRRLWDFFSWSRLLRT